CGPALHPPLVSSHAALPRRATCCHAALPGTEPRHPVEPRRPAEPCCSSAATTATAATAAMASPTVLTFDAEGRAVDFDVWVDDLQLLLQCDSRDGVSLFDHTSGVSTAPAATADSTVRSQWTNRDAVARLAVRSHLPPAERAHFGQYKTAKSLYDAAVARYSSPATAALNRLMLPYLFSDLAAFATVADLITHLCTSDAHHRAALPTEDHFLSLCPTELTVDLLEDRLTAAEKSILAVGASRGDPRTPFFEGCSPVPLLPSVASAVAVDLVGTEEVGAPSAPSGRRCNSKGKGSKGGGGDGGGGGGGGGGGRGRGGGGGGGGGSGGFGGGGGGSGGSGSGGGGSGSGGGGSCSSGGGGGGGGTGQGAAAQCGGFGGSQRQQQPRSRETPSAQQLCEWYAGSGRSRGVGPCTYVLRTGRSRGETQNVAIFDLDFDAILAAMYAVTDSAEGDCYLSVPPDPGIGAAALGASASAAPGTGESAAPGAVLRALSFAIAPPSRRSVGLSQSPWLSGLHLPSFSMNLVSGADLQDAWVDLFAPGGQRVTHCTCSRTGRHLATFTRRPGSSLYTLTTESPPVFASCQVAASSQVFAAASRSGLESAPCSCRPLSHETLLWHHRLGHPSLPRLRGMASRTLVSGLPRSLPHLPPRPAPTCVPSVEGRQRAAPHSSTFPPTEAPLQTLHMDVWGPARVRGQGHERYFLLVVDDYSRYTTIFPLRSKGDVTEVLIDWIRGARRQLSERFGSDLPVLRLHLDRGGEFSSDLLRAFCRAEGIRLTFTLPASPQQNGIAERRIGMVMDVAPSCFLAGDHTYSEVDGKVGDVFAFRVWGSQAFVRDTSADKLPSRAIPCVFLGFPPDAPGWQFYHPTLRRVLSSQDVTFDESVSYYHPAEPVEVAVHSGAARGAEPAGVGTGGAEPEASVSEGAEPGGAEPERVEPGGAESGGPESWGAEPGRAESGGPRGVPSRREPLSPQQLCEWYTRRCCGIAGGGGAVGAAGAGAAGGASGAAGGTAGAGAAGGAAGGTGAVGGPAGVVAAGGAGAAGPKRARNGGTGAAGAGGAARVRAAGTGAVATGGAFGAGAVGGTGAGGAAGVVAGDPEAEGTGAVSAVSGGAARPRPYYVPLLQQLQLASPLPGPSPYSGPTRGLTERREPESHPVSPESCSASLVHTRVPLPFPLASSLPDGPDPESDSLRAASPTVSRFLTTAVTDTLFASTAASALVVELVDFAAACRLDFAAGLVAKSVSAFVCPPSVGGECALGTDVLEDRQEEFESFAAAVPPLVSMLLAPEGDPDAPDIPTPRSYAEAIEGPYSSQWQAAMDAEMASWKSTGTYVDKVPPPGANIVSGMWIFRVKRPPGSPPVFKARYVARGFSQRQGVDFF
ncbi:unnamed protein product, partial [Closterium sp. NIES-53]